MGIFNWIMEYYSILIIFTNIWNISGSFLLSPEDPCERNASECAILFKELEKALLQDETNKFQMRRAFFHSPTADPVLLRVIYNVFYAENIIATEENKLYLCGHIPTVNEKGEMDGANLENSVAKNQTKCENKQNSSISELLHNLTKQHNYAYGWTSTGVYTVFHPMVLYMMQAQTPFLALKFVHNYILQDQRSLEANTFLWNGSSSDLPTLRLNLCMTKVLCTSTQAVFEKVLNEINTLVSTYSNDTVVKYDYYVY